MNDLKSGFYWVRFNPDDDWTVARLGTALRPEERRWYITGCGGALRTPVEIGDRIERITPLKETITNAKVVITPKTQPDTTSNVEPAGRHLGMFEGPQGVVNRSTDPQPDITPNSLTLTPPGSHHADADDMTDQHGRKMTAQEWADFTRRPDDGSLSEQEGQWYR